MVEFLVSYNRDDGGGGLVEDFFADLSEEVATRRAGWSKESVGYLDVKVETGSRWPNRLVAALGETRVFLALYSPRYFGSEYCGKEWTIFTDRVRRYERENTTTADLILPVLWVPTPKTDIPEVARPLQYKESDFPEQYGAKGLRRLVALKQSFPVEYREVLEVLASRIVACQDAHQLTTAMTPADLTTAANAFVRPGSAATTEQDQSAKGPRRVYFVIAAPTAAEAATVRDHPEGRYAGEPDEWMPYGPADTTPLILYANDVARGQDPPLLPKQQRADGQDLIELIRKAEERNAIVVIIADAWSALLPKYCDALRPYDSYYSLQTAVIVPTSDTDVETVHNLSTLQREMRTLFDKTYRGGARFYRDAVTSPAAFKHELGKALIRTQSNVFRTGDVPEETQPSEFDTTPTLTGPSGS